MLIKCNWTNRITSLLFSVILAGMGTVMGQLPSWDWARAVNSGSFEIVNDVVANPVTNVVYMVGTWSNDLSAIFPPGAYSSTDFSSTYGGDDGFVAKYDDSGALLWAFKVGGDHNDEVSGISLDSAGNVYITGTFGRDENYFSGNSPLSGTSTLSNVDKLDCFIAKYDADGSFVWIRRSQTDTDDIEGTSIHVAGNSLYATGINKSMCSFGSVSISRLFGSIDVFLVKYDLDGNEQWVISGGSHQDDLAPALVAENGNVFIAGHFHGDQIDLSDTGGGLVSTILNANSGKEDIFLASYSKDGIFNWCTTISGANEDYCFGMTADNDSLYLTGGVHDLAVFPAFTGNPVTSSANADIFFSSHAKANGNTGWAYTIPCTDGGSEFGNAIHLDRKGDLFITGYFRNNISFPGATVLSSLGAEDVFISCITSDGLFKWAKSVGSSGKDIGFGISTGTIGSIYTGGSYDKEVFFDLLSLPDDGGDNAFLAKLLEPCTDAIGGSISSDKMEMCVGEVALLTLTGHSGDIEWQESPSGQGSWTAIGGASMDSVKVSPTIHTDYRAFITYGACNPDSSNEITIDVYNIPKADPGPGGETCGNVFGLQANPSVGTGMWSQTSGTGTSTFTPSASDPVASAAVTVYGAYEFTWTETNGPCSDDSAINVIFYEPPLINPGSGGEVCGLLYNLDATPSSGVGSWSLESGPGTAIFSPSENDPDASVSVSDHGNFEFRWTEIEGTCSDHSIISVTFSDPPVSDAGADDEVCIVDGSYTLAGTTSSNGTILWTSSGDGSFDDSTSDNPTYTIGSENGSVTLTKRVTSPGSCADSVDAMVLTLVPSPVSDAGVDDEVCIVDGSYTLAGTTSSNGTILWTSSGDGSFDDATSDNPTYTIGSENGSVTLTKRVTDPGSCADSADAMVLTLVPGPVSDAGADDEVCIVDGSYTLAGTTSSNGTILWTSSGDGSFDDSTSDNPTYTIGSENGSVTLTKRVTSPGSCADSVDAMVLTLVPSPVSDAGVDDEVCIVDGSYTLAGTTSSNGTILWTSSGDGSFDDSTSDNPTYTIGSENGSVTLTKRVTSPGSCADSVDAMVLTLVPRPVSDAGVDDEVCIVDGSYTLAGTTSSNGTILWTSSGDGSFDDATSDNPTYTIGSENGSVTLTKRVTGPGSCADSVDAMVLTLVPSPVSDAGADDEVCIVDGSYTLAGTTSSNGTILWTSSGDGSFDDATSDNPTYTIGSENGSVTLTKRVTDPGSCADSVDAMVLTLVPGPVSDAGADDEVCIVDGSYTLTGTTSSNGTILWTSSGDGSFDDATSDNPTYTIGSENGSVTLTKRVTSPGSCADSVDAMVLTLVPSPVSDAGVDDEVCIVDGSYTLAGTTSSNGTILWTSSGNGSFDDSTSDNPTYTIGSENGSITLTKRVTGPGSCADSVDVMVLTLVPRPVSDAGADDEVCIVDGSYTLAGTTSSNGTILWTSSGNGSFDDSTSDNPTYTIGSENGSITLTKRVTGPGSCADSVDAMVLTLVPSPVSEAGEGGTTCSLNFQLHANSGDHPGRWSLATGTGSATFAPSDSDPDAIVTVSDYGTYSLIWKVNNRICSDSDSVELVFMNGLTTDAGEDGSVCGRDFRLSAIPGGGSGVWIKYSGPGNARFDPSDTLHNATVSVSDYGSYVFQWTESLFDCTGTDRVLVDFYQQPESDAGPDQGLDFVFSTVMEAAIPVVGSGLWVLETGSGTFENETDPQSEISNLSVGDNLFSWKVSNGACTDAMDQVTITVRELFTPTLISPNNDGENDFLVFQGLEFQKGSQLIIYNRWGTEVFRSGDYKNDWDGKDKKGRDLIPDIYYYVLELPSSGVIRSFVEIRR